MFRARRRPKNLVRPCSLTGLTVLVVPIFGRSSTHAVCRWSLSSYMDRQSAGWSPIRPKSITSGDTFRFLMQSVKASMRSPCVRNWIGCWLRSRNEGPRSSHSIRIRSGVRVMTATHFRSATRPANETPSVGFGSSNLWAISNSIGTRALYPAVDCPSAGGIVSVAMAARLLGVLRRPALARPCCPPDCAVRLATHKPWPRQRRSVRHTVSPASPWHPAPRKSDLGIAEDRPSSGLFWYRNLPRRIR